MRSVLLLAAALYLSPLSVMADEPALPYLAKTAKNEPLKTEMNYQLGFRNFTAEKLKTRHLTEQPYVGADIDIYKESWPVVPNANISFGYSPAVTDVEVEGYSFAVFSSFILMELDLGVKGYLGPWEHRPYLGGGLAGMWVLKGAECLPFCSKDVGGDKANGWYLKAGYLYNRGRLPRIGIEATMVGNANLSKGGSLNHYRVNLLFNW